LGTERRRKKGSKEEGSNTTDEAIDYRLVAEEKVLVRDGLEEVLTVLELIVLPLLLFVLV
jgi:hypothetical protein